MKFFMSTWLRCRGCFEYSLCWSCIHKFLFRLWRLRWSNQALSWRHQYFWACGKRVVSSSDRVSDEPLKSRIQNNAVERKENWLFNIFSETRYFYSIGETYFTIQNRALFDNAYLIINIKLSQRYENYERTVFTFFDMFGMLGGIFELFSLVGFIAVHRISTNMFNNSLLSNLYQVRAQPGDSVKVIPKKKVESVLE